MVVGQITSFNCVVIFYSAIIKELKNGTTLGPESVYLGKNVMVQSLLITVTNALCWLPSSIIYIISIAMETYPISLLLWNAFLINPLNSLMNPIIFCFIPFVKDICARTNFSCNNPH